MMSEGIMNSRMLNTKTRITTIAFILVGLGCVLPMASMAQAQPAAKTAAVAQKGFDTPQQAADALIKAAGDFDVPELLAILGPDGQDIVESSDPVQDKNNAQAFAKEAAAKNSVQWPSPIRTAPPSLWAKNSGHCRFLW